MPVNPSLKNIGKKPALQSSFSASFLTVFKNPTLEANQKQILLDMYMHKVHTVFLGCLHCNKNPINVFLEKELIGPSPCFHIPVSVSDFYIPRIDPHIFLQQER